VVGARVGDDEEARLLEVDSEIRGTMLNKIITIGCPTCIDLSLTSKILVRMEIERYPLKE
jgi:hypothetical protein